MSTEVLVPIYEAIETPEEKPVPETLFSTQLKIEELGTNIDLKDADVIFTMKNFMKSFFIHLLFFSGFGPFTNLLVWLPGMGISRELMGNFDFSLSGKNIMVKVLQGILWCFSVTIIVILMAKSYTRDCSLMDLHKDGYDLVFTSQLFVMIFIRAWMIAMKYGTFSEKMNLTIN